MNGEGKGGGGRGLRSTNLIIVFEELYVSVLHLSLLLHSMVALE